MKILKIYTQNILSINTYLLSLKINTVFHKKHQYLMKTSSNSSQHLQKIDTISLFSIKSMPMRVFHLTWITFFLCFFGWFGIAPLMAIVRDEFKLTKPQIGNIIIASVAVTVFARLLFGWLCDKIGPRLSYTYLLAFGSLPVIFIGLSNSYETFLLFRLAIGVIGAAFVITQYHTSVMFAPKVVGTANATVAGWGNLGGGVTQMIMPIIFAAIVATGFTNAQSWRYAMVLPGVALFLMSFIYYRFTTDCPEGNYADLRKTNPDFKAKSKDVKGSFWVACQDYRTWVLFLTYGACFGIEITVDNVAALYFMDNFELGIKEAGLIAGSFGLMNLFARALGGYFGDKVGNKFGLKARGWILAAFLLCEGIGIICFSQTQSLALAVGLMLTFALFVKMSNGATYSVVPFINKSALGSVSGIVGAGGNVGAVLAGFLFKSESITYRDAFFYLGISVIVVALITVLVKFEKSKLTTTQNMELETI